jgi:hypothetical protein
VGKHTVAIPEPVRLHCVKVDDPGVCGPSRIVFQIVMQKMQVVVWDKGDGITFTDCERVHDDLVGKDVNTVVDDAFEVVEVVGDLACNDLKPATLHREHAGVDPIPRRLLAFGKPKEFRFAFVWLPALFLRHELIRVYEADIGNKQRREIDLRGKDGVEVDVYDNVGHAFQDRVEL